MKHIETDDFVITIIDCPGHRDFVPNMMNGAAEADAAIIVIDSKVGAYEDGFKKATGYKEYGGQTGEHLNILKSMGL